MAISLIVTVIYWGRPLVKFALKKEIVKSLVKCTVRVLSFSVLSTLGPAYNNFGYNEYPPTAIRVFSIKIIDSNVKKFGD